MRLGKPCPIAVVLGLALSLTVAVSLPGCRKKKRAPFSCAELQKRTSRCERHLLTALEKRYRADVKTGARTAAEAAAQLKAIQWRVRRRIRYQGAKRLCERSQEVASPEHRRRFSTMKFCFQRSGCPAFAECMLGLW